MAEIEIPFNAWSKDKLRRGIKHSTFRYKQYGQAGDTFKAEGKKFQILRYERKTGAELIEEDYITEGAQTPEELRKVLDGICRGKFNPQKIGIKHIFLEVDD